MTDQPLDCETIRRAIANRGDTKTWEQIQKKLYPVVVSILGNSSPNVRDAMQNATMGIFRGFSSFNPAGVASLTTWIGTIARNAALDELRKLKRYRNVFSEVDDKFDPEYHGPHDKSHIEAFQDRQLLAKAIESLEPRFRVVVALRRLGYTNKDTAVELGINEGTVKSRLSRAALMIRSYCAASEMMHQGSSSAAVTPIRRLGT